MKIKKIGSFLLAALLTITLAACSSNTSTDSPTPAPTATPTTTATPTLEPTTVTDREGNILTLPQNVDKIISMAPSITETLVDLGLADKIVAVDTYSVDVKGLKSDIPTFDSMSPDGEKIAALKPDIVFVSGMSESQGSDPFQPLKDLGTLVTDIPSASSIEGIQDDIRFIGTITKTSDKADSIIADMQTKIDTITAKIPQTDTQKTVYFEISPAPTAYSFGTNTFLNEMIELLGAKNILADQNSWVSVSDESVITKNPDVIFTNVNYVETPVDEILKRSGWDVINAVKNKQVYQIDTNSSSRPSEYITVALEQMAKALYPDIFK